MKKITMTLLALMLCLGMVAVPAAAAEGMDVYVTISSEGELVAAREKVTVTDADGDGALTINDALFCAHEALYEGGAEAGYAYGDTEYGISLNKLWGVENGGSYGYYVNDVGALSMSDPIKAGDCVSAFSYADLEAWSDAYAYFDQTVVETAAGKSVKLALTYNSGYDESWNQVFEPCAGAIVTADGKEYTTDENGAVELSFDKAGTYVVSASSETATLVPPVAVVTVRSFADTVGCWAADEIESVVAKGLFGGTGKGFEPKTVMSRAMLVTVLHRLDGEPAVEGENAFADVVEDAYYADAVAWANANGIVTGYAGSFQPNDDITREQMAAILWRYAKYKGYDVSVGEDTNILSYEDAFSIQEYAIPAMQWACGAGLINGSDGCLNPAGGAAREQVAVILSRFMTNVK